MGAGLVAPALSASKAAVGGQPVGVSAGVLARQSWHLVVSNAATGAAVRRLRGVADDRVEVQWDLLDDSGQGVPAGNYTITLASTGGGVSALPWSAGLEVVAMHEGGQATVSPSPLPTPPPGSVGSELPGERWAPEPGTAWQWQLTGDLDLSVDVPVYDLDGFDTSAETVAQLHAQGRRAICYLSVGAWEDWRPDAARFPENVLGASNGWPGERWLDVRRIDVLAPVLRERLAMCRAKGFDAVEPDNVDGYVNETGFPLTHDDQLIFNRWVAAEAHGLGMSVGLKNDLDQVLDLVADFDFAVNEQCFQYSECDALLPFVQAGKAVLHVEYSVSADRFCGRVPPGFSSMEKRYELDAWRKPC
jgi:hypothetical protein